MNTRLLQILFSVTLLLLAAIAPNIFPLVQAGYGNFSTLAITVLLPSITLVFVIIFFAQKNKLYELKRLSLNGIKAGIAATVSLEIIREAGFHLGAMPGDLPRLMGVLLLNKFASGPDVYSDIAGWLYHFWNGAAFGLIFSILFGKSKSIEGILFGLVIAIGFMISPVVKSLGIGVFGKDFKNGYQFALTVILAHIAFGISLSLLLQRWNNNIQPVWLRLKIHSRRLQTSFKR